MVKSVSSEDEWVDQPSSRTVAKKKRNINVVEPTEGESNLKGFASAFATIMDRPVVSQAMEPKTQSTSSAAPKRTPKPKEEKLVVGHIEKPLINDVREEGFKQSAERGVVKLFKAVAMTRKRAIETEASKGIGVTKSGQIRRLRRPSLGTSAQPEKTKTMASFLDALKKAKSDNQHSS